jgi:hypothetical protein
MPRDEPHHCGTLRLFDEESRNVFALFRGSELTFLDLLLAETHVSRKLVDLSRDEAQELRVTMLSHVFLFPLTHRYQVLPVPV